MPRWMRCVVEEVTVRVRAAEYAECIGEGKIVDFDQVLIKEHGEDKQPYTLADALGHHAHPVDPDVPDGAARAFVPADDPTVTPAPQGDVADDDVAADEPVADQRVATHDEQPAQPAAGE